MVKRVFMLTGVVLAKNEEENIGACLEALCFCDEVIVVDDFSTDKTVEIAKKKGAIVFERKLIDDFAGQRNFALSKIKSGWVLFVDADEIVPLELAEEIKAAVAGSGVDGYYLRRHDVIFGKRLKFGETSKTNLLRLARKKSGYWERRVHEVWKIDGEIGQLKEQLLHYPHQTITKFLKEINKYSTLHARVLHETGVRTSFFQIIFYPLAKFFQNYLLRLGFLDKMPGLVIALVMSLHSFLARGKLYFLWQKAPGGERSNEGGF